MTCSPASRSMMILCNPLLWILLISLPFFVSVALVMDLSWEDKTSQLAQFGPVDEIGALGTRVVVAAGLPFRAAEAGTMARK